MIRARFSPTRSFARFIFLSLALAGAALAGAGDHERIGSPGEWSSTTAGAALGDALYFVDAGMLYKCSPRDGSYEQVGEENTWKTKFLLPLDGALYALEEGGSLYRVDPKNGTYEEVANAEYANAQAATVLDGKLYIVDGGKLYAVDKAGKYEQVGDENAWKTVVMVGHRGKLFLFEEGGNLYRVDPKSGAYEQLGESADWAGITAACALGDKIYAFENGILYAADPKDGSSTEVGGEGGWKARILVASGDRLFAIEPGGDLYRISVK